MVSHPFALDSEILAYYERGGEAPRLLHGVGRLEFARTQEIILRNLPAPPSVVYDVGGGPGLYSCWLAGLEYQVHLVDATSLHVEQAWEASCLQPEHPLAAAVVGDARRLDFDDTSADVVLLLGPLYHLTQRQDRMLALQEVRRVLRPGGMLFAAAISRYASALDGLLGESLLDPDFAAIVERDLVDGQHRNPHSNRDYFTTAFFHTPAELASEVAEAGYRDCQILGVEGPGWLMQDFEARWQDLQRREVLLRVARYLEAEPTLSGLSSHFLAVART